MKLTHVKKKTKNFFGDVKHAKYDYIFLKNNNNKIKH